MSWIIIGLLGFAALMLVFSLFKKLVKLAFTAVALLLLVAGIWYFWQRDPPEIPDSVRQAGEEAAETLKQAAGKAVDKAAEAVKEGAGEAMNKAAEAVKEGAQEAVDKAAEAVQEDAAGTGDETAGEGGEDQTPQGDPAGEPEHH